MRCAILGDVHANLTAFQAVLGHAQAMGGYDEIWCLGDIVGYGPDPGDCIALLRSHKHVCVAGNHDLAAIGKMDTSWFNSEAGTAARWTGEHLSPEEAQFLDALPLSLQQGDFTLVHGSPRDPIWEYVTSLQVATRNFAGFDTSFCLIGHSHIPLLFALNKQGVCTLRPLPPELALRQEGDRLIINCGSVGQPRDGDPRAAYALLDTDTNILSFFRVEYDVQETQRRMLLAGLPRRLAERLRLGW